jgi:mRNA interferase RelE/StbE
MPEKSWRIELSGDSLKQLRKLRKGDRRRILDKLAELEFGDHPAFHRDVRPLAGKLKGFYRLRCGDFRMIFEIDREGKRIGILAVIHRGDAY